MSRELSRQDRSQGLQRVEVDALVILKIMKHARDQTGASGKLMGLDVGAVLQVTHSFATPERNIESGDTTQDSQYSLEMMKALREVNVDANTVGWYTSTYLSHFLTERLLEEQIGYQEKINDKCVVLVFDPLQNAIGRLAFRAFRVTDELVKRRKEANQRGQPLGMNLQQLQCDNLLEEVPLSINNPLLVEAFLVDNVLGDPFQSSVDLDTLDFDNSAYMQKNLSALIDCLDDLASEESKRQFLDKRQPRPYMDRRYNPMDSLLISSQIQNYCRDINTYSEESMGKLFVVNHSVLKQDK
ncbi:unnamed protein product [Vitrella brassicaformis CCMP3155]|uniref:MPN domain-containing protein n=2 Tax=Vitrella brassicaformis TaxID=1169539 RepID=A0A0G4FDP0_VITBC|nr:unnamed protein product [Vitrella brassicaformis CCMP3155]|mmetsp:Transcript_45525/g.128517  ORF Transcript_45525/g.128517 Transcript_45525/m.128517 type:complete len:299 (+) Transcript_45525:55-951(+)|eukprot:CEM11294.1 unnamed protein product [Vitrella brassicaformis CCMP3155]